MRSAQDDERLEARHFQYCSLLDTIDNPGGMVRIGRGVGVGRSEEPGIRFESERLGAQASRGRRTPTLPGVSRLVLDLAQL